MYSKKDVFYLVIVILLLVSCSSHYKIMSFLFDGVPNPNDTLINATNDSLNQIDSMEIQGTRKIEPQFVFHPPYLDKNCSGCHDQNSMGKLSQPQPGLCYNCHEDFNDTYSFLHGPVAGGYCTACHSPHMSKSEKLLLQSGQQLCLYCHNSTQVFKNENHEDIEDTNCIECHNPHGGEDRYILN